jgi:hypothetical protein
VLAKALQSALLVRAVAASFVEIEKAHAVRINQGIKEQWVAGTHYSPTISSYMLGCFREPITVSGPSPQV